MLNEKVPAWPWAQPVQHGPSRRAISRLRGRTVRSRLLAGVAAIAMMLGLIFASASTASANTPSNWSGTYDGVEFGWTSNHAWAIASYATVWVDGAGFVAGEICGVLVSEGFGPFSASGELCSAAVEPLVAAMVRGSQHLNNHGIWIAWYPWGNYTQQGTY